MVRPVTPYDSARGNSRPAGKRRTRRVLNTRILVGTFTALVVLGIAAYFWRGYQVRRTASALTERAEALAEEKHFAAAAGYYSRYLELCPEDANARLRRAELFEQSAGGLAGRQTSGRIVSRGLEACQPGACPEKQLMARRRLTELLLQAGEFAAAESEVEKLRELERRRTGREAGGVAVAGTEGPGTGREVPRKQLGRAARDPRGGVCGSPRAGEGRQAQSV